MIETLGVIMLTCVVTMLVVAAAIAVVLGWAFICYVIREVELKRARHRVIMARADEEFRRSPT